MDYGWGSGREMDKFRNRILKENRIKADSQVAHLSKWEMLVLFSEIRTPLKEVWRRQRDDVFYFRDGQSVISETLQFIQ